MCPTHLLLPPPKHVELTGGQTVFSALTTWMAGLENKTATQKLQMALPSSHPGDSVHLGGTYPVILNIDGKGARGPQSYEIVVDTEETRIVGADAAGLFYGVCSLTQLLRVSGGTIPNLRIRDWPDFKVRGVMLDVSRDRVPTMATLEELVDRLAGWKINQLQLYMEHTFAYRGHEVVWGDASPFTADEIKRLAVFCRSHHIDLVPNQNSFGHMHRWLSQAPYRNLAECPEGVDHPFSQTREPYSLCPIDPGSLHLLEDLYDQLLPNFDSTFFNVGFDETFDLGMGRSAQACAEQGATRVYLDFLHKVHRLVSERGRRMQCWGDIIVRRPDLIGELPKDVIPLIWGYEADHPFSEQCQHFADAGLEFLVCPGTSSWNSISGRTDNMLGNLANAAVAGRDAGASGLLVTDWGDNGHLQPPPVSYAGFAVGAAFAWSTAAAADHTQLPLADLLNHHAFEDSAGAAGDAVLRLGATHLATNVQLRNGTILSRLLLTPDAWPESRIPEELTGNRLEEARDWVDQVEADLGKTAMQRPDAELLAMELEWVAAAHRWACQAGTERLAMGLARPLSAITSPAREHLAEGMRDLVRRYQEIWLARSRQGGLSDSVARLQHSLTHLEP